VIDEVSDTESGSSYIGSGESSPRPRTCRWRTSEFYDQECSRYFDCPTHVVERRVRDNDLDDEDVAHAGRALASIELQSEDDFDSSAPRNSGAALSPAMGETNSSFESPNLGEILDEEDRAPPPEDLEALDAEPTVLRQVDGPAEASGGMVELDVHPEDGAPPVPPARNSSQPELPPLPIIRLPEESSSNLVHLNSSGNEATGTRSPRLSSQEESNERRGPPEIVLPRWQPDAEVTICPICHTQFSIFVRKHHCR
jgi:hypothetical protein